MKAVCSVLIVLPLLGAAIAPVTASDYFPYISPRPDATLVAQETTIILRPASPPTGGVNAFASIEVQGSISGFHAGDWTVAERGKTFIFRPREPFAPGEKVSVTVPIEGREPGDLSFRFTISPNTADLREAWIGAHHPGDCAVISAAKRWSSPASLAPHDVSIRPTAPDPRSSMILPEFFPGLTVTINDNPGPGYLFVGPRLWGGEDPRYAVMLDNTGTPAFFRELPSMAGDFKKQKHANLISYCQYGENAFHVVNESFEFQDAFSPTNGYYVLDGHDFQYAPNGNVLVGIIDLQTVDMSVIVPGGDPNATVHGFVMQEQDSSHNVVFQWRSWDHIPITDAAGVDFTAPFIDCIHFNAFEIDTDGNILFSFRELNEITKIDRNTGDIIWRFGGNQNEYTLVDETQLFTRQHSVRRTPTGTVTIFDNASHSVPPESRAVEYDLDEINKVATKVWQFRDSPPLLAAWGSNVQRLPNGNTVIDWAPLGMVTEVRSDGTKAFEMAFHDGFWTYRAFRFEWDGVAARPELWHYATPFQVTLHFVKFGDPDVAQFHVYRGSSPNPTTRVGSTPDSSFALDVLPTEVLYVRVTAEDSLGHESPFSNERQIIVPGGVEAPLIGSFGSQIALHQNHPNPFAPSTTISFALSERGFADLTVYDVRGRLVRRLVHDVTAQGLSRVVWDGTDARGRRAGSGTYFFRLNAGDQEMTKRMTLLRRH